MKLGERLTQGEKKEISRVGATPVDPNSFFAVKTRLHSLVLDKLDMRAVGEVDPKRMRERLRQSVSIIVNADGEAANLEPSQRLAVVEAILDEIVGLGPLEQLLADPAISDVLVNAFDKIYIERNGKLELTPIRFADNTHLLNTIQRIVSRVGRRVDESSPMVDARLPDGSRVNAVVPPIATDGPSLSIRRFGRRLMDPNDLIKRGVATASMFKYLAAAVRAKCNLLVSGGTGAGKTTLLNILSSFIPGEERVITIEDSAELSLQGHHVVRMEARPPNIEGKGEVTIRACVKNALRMRPDRIVIGEIRGGEVLDMLQAMNTGHEGSMGTVHSNTPKDAVDRLMMMLALADVGLTNESMMKFIGRSVRIIVQVARFPDGPRRITHIAEIVDQGDDNFEVRMIFSYNILEERFVYHGNSTIQDRILEHGIKLDLRTL